MHNIKTKIQKSVFEALCVGDCKHSELKLSYQPGTFIRSIYISNPSVQELCAMATQYPGSRQESASGFTCVRGNPEEMDNIRATTQQIQTQKKKIMVTNFSFLQVKPETQDLLIRTNWQIFFQDLLTAWSLYNSQKISNIFLSCRL